MAETLKESKGAPKTGSNKKNLLIVLAVIVVLAGAIGGYMVHQRTTEEYRNIADALLYRTHWLSRDQRNEMLAGTGIYGPKYMEIRDKDRFRKILAEQFQLMLDEKETAWSTMNFRSSVCKSIASLEEQGVQDENIRDIYRSYMAEQKETVFAKIDSAPSRSNTSSRI